MLDHLFSIDKISWNNYNKKQNNFDQQSKIVFNAPGHLASPSNKLVNPISFSMLNSLMFACLHCSQINAKSFVGRWAFNYFSIDITLCLCLKICYSICFITIWITLGLYHKILINSLTVVFLLTGKPNLKIHFGLIELKAKTLLRVH